MTMEVDAKDSIRKTDSDTQIYYEGSKMNNNLWNKHRYNGETIYSRLSGTVGSYGSHVTLGNLRNSCSTSCNSDLFNFYENFWLIMRCRPIFTFLLCQHLTYDVIHIIKYILIQILHLWFHSIFTWWWSIAPKHFNKQGVTVVITV